MSLPFQNRLYFMQQGRIFSCVLHNRNSCINQNFSWNYAGNLQLVGQHLWKESIDVSGLGTLHWNRSWRVSGPDMPIFFSLPTDSLTNCASSIFVFYFKFPTCTVFWFWFCFSSVHCFYFLLQWRWIKYSAAYERTLNHCHQLHEFPINYASVEILKLLPVSL